MKKKRNILKRNSGFLIGCVLAAGASFATADTLMEKGLPVLTSDTEGAETETTQTVAPETAENRVYETDAFTVTASGNIIKGVETETEQQTETETAETDENGNPIAETAETDADGNPVGSETYDDGSGSSDSYSDGSYSDGSGYSDGSYSDGSGYSDSSYSDGGGSSSGGDYTGDTYYDQPIEIYDPGNGDYYYTDDGSSGSGSSGGSSGGSSSGTSSGGSSSDIIVSTPDDVILWGISERYIDESELYNYSAAELRLIRNEIFALHGRMFNSQDLMDYFSQKSWYVPMYAPEDFDANMFDYLNDYEEANLNVILNYEAALAGN